MLRYPRGKATGVELYSVFSKKFKEIKLAVYKEGFTTLYLYHSPW